MQTACITVRVWNEISQKRSNSGRLLLLKVSAFAHPFGLVANVLPKRKAIRFPWCILEFPISTENQ
jgi:hypothetical protein